MNQDPFEEQIATYALGAMEAEDRLKLEAHLRRCPHCKAELRHARAVVNQLPLAVDPVQPSARTRLELLARVRADLAPDSPAVMQSRRWVPVLALVVTGVLALVVGLLSTPLLAQLEQRLEMEAILRNPRANARPIMATQEGRGEGKLMAIPDENRAVLVVNGLPPLPEDKTYELWMGHGREMTPAGLFRVDANGNATMLVSCDEPTSRYDTLGVSVERRTGEQTLHGPIMLKSGF